MNILPEEVMGFSVSGAAGALSINRETIARMVRDGKIKSVFIGGVRIIPRAEIERLLTEGDGSSSQRGVATQMSMGRREKEPSDV